MSSPEEFWNAIEVRYGEIPNLIKLILQVNGFNSFLAMKGIRYDDKQEFFQSLELTVLEILNSEFDLNDKQELEAELAAGYQTTNNFRIKPGHRNYIMNLMLEIEKLDVQEFFGQEQSTVESSSYESRKKCLSPSMGHEYTIGQVALPESSNEIIVSQSKDRQIVLNQVDHGYSRDEDESEYILEEEYLTDETGDALDVMDSLIKLEYDPGSSSSGSQGIKRKSSSSTPTTAKRRPDRMYNEEFMMKCVNPRRRRVTLNKAYPKTDEGTRERFIDLIQQVSSMSVQGICN